MAGHQADSELLTTASGRADSGSFKLRTVILIMPGVTLVHVTARALIIEIIQRHCNFIQRHCENIKTNINYFIINRRSQSDGLVN